MRNSPMQHALLPNLAGSNLPGVALTVSAQYQFCVDAGASAAVGFFDDLAAVGLHDHIACSMHVFMSSVREGLAAMDDYPLDTIGACTDAFAAGYLGRVQQELRLFQGEHLGRPQAITDPRMFTSCNRTDH